MATIGKETLQSLGFEMVIAIEDPAAIINGRAVACRTQKFKSLDAVKEFFKDSSLIVVHDRCRSHVTVEEGEEVYVRLFPICNYGTVELAHSEMELIMDRRRTYDPEQDIAEAGAQVERLADEMDALEGSRRKDVIEWKQKEYNVAKARLIGLIQKRDDGNS